MRQLDGEIKYLLISLHTLYKTVVFYKYFILQFVV